MNDINKIKNEIRQLYLKKRNALSEDYIKNASLIIEKNVLKTNEYKSARTVLLYSAVKGEVLTDLIFEKAVSDGKTVSFPTCFENGEMDFFIINDLGQLRRGKYGILEPFGDLKKAVTEDALCITPSVTCDRFGTRLGRGGGYYDRFLRINKVTALCVQFEELICEERLPKGVFDMPYDLLITEGEREK